MQDSSLVTLQGETPKASVITPLLQERLRSGGFSETGMFLCAPSSLGDETIATHTGRGLSGNMMLWPIQHVAHALDVPLDEAFALRAACAAKLVAQTGGLLSARDPAPCLGDPSSHGVSTLGRQAAPAKRLRDENDSEDEAGCWSSGKVSRTSPACTVLSMLLAGTTVVATGLQALDRLMLGGLPRAMITEIVGASGSGKSLLAQSIAAYAATAADGDSQQEQRVVVIDTESRWSASLVQNMIRQRIDRQQGDPSSSTSSLAEALRRVDFVRTIRSLEELKSALPELQAGLIGKSRLSLLVVDSFASLVRGSFSGHPDETLLRLEAVLGAVHELKGIAEALGIAVLITSHAGSDGFIFPGALRDSTEVMHSPSMPYGGAAASAAFGTSFYHAVNTRLVLEEMLLNGRRVRLLRVAKSPLCPPMAFELLLGSEGDSEEGDGIVESDTRLVSGENERKRVSIEEVKDANDDREALVRLRELPSDVTRVVCAQLGIASRAQFHAMTNTGAHATAPRFPDLR
jgi:RecA/RadA recombinase